MARKRQQLQTEKNKILKGEYFSDNSLLAVVRQSVPVPVFFII